LSLDDGQGQMLRRLILPVCWLVVPWVVIPAGYRDQVLHEHVGGSCWSCCYLFCDDCKKFWSAERYVFRLTRLECVNFVRQSCLSKLTPYFVDQLWQTKLKIGQLCFDTNFALIRPAIFSKQNCGVSFDHRVLSSIRVGLKT
jgi:hypothetical protein